MAEFDKLMISKGFYCRYVNDCLFNCSSTKILSKIRNYLKRYRKLNLHPNKVVVQNVTKGVPFIGYFIKSNKILSGKELSTMQYKL